MKERDANFVVTDFDSGYTQAGKEAIELLAALEDEVKNMKLPEGFKRSAEGVQLFIKWIDISRNSLNTMKKNLIAAQASFIELGKAAKGIIGGQAFLDRKNNEILNQEISYLNEQYRIEQTLSGLSEEEFALTERAVELTNKRTAAEEKRIDPSIIAAKNAVDELKTLKKVTEISKKRLANEQKLRNIITQARASGGTLSPQQELKIQTQAAELKIKTAKLDLAFTMAKIKAERALLVAQFGGKDKLTKDHKEVLRLLDAQNAVVQQMARQSVSAAETGVTSAIQGSMSGFDTGFDRMGSSGLGVEGFKMQIEGIKNLAVAQNVLTQATENSEKATARFITLQEEASAAKGKPEEQAANQAAQDALLSAQAAEAVVLQAQNNVKNAALQMVADTMTGLSQTLEQLGPDGALAAAFGNLGTIC